jgi:DNA-binding NarL/FixJ family response regulator
MPRGGHDGTLPVCLIEQNPLGLEYLLGFLRKDSSIRVFGIQDLEGRGDREKAMAPVVIVDNCGLPLPLGECLRGLRFRYPDAKYVVLDHELPKEDLLRLLWIKIDGFLPYAEVPRSLLAAVHSVAEDDIWIPREVLREYVQWSRELRRKDSSGREQMTSRENQIIQLVKRRLSNKEIADILGIRESTVKFHLTNVYSKLQVGSRHDLIKSGPESSALGLLQCVLPR